MATPNKRALLCTPYSRIAIAVPALPAGSQRAVLATPSSCFPYMTAPFRIVTKLGNRQITRTNH
jgi:hypothetical protein